MASIDAATWDDMYRRCRRVRQESEALRFEALLLTEQSAAIRGVIPSDFPSIYEFVASER
jgi:hypothetical protein